MFKHYNPTDLEIYVENLYKSIGIRDASDLCIENVATGLNIEIVYMEYAPNRAIYDDDFCVIFLNPKKPNMKDIFFHEIAHPLRHYGDQESMNIGSLDELQEIQANQFQLYAAIPFFLIAEFPEKEIDFVHYLSKTFDVSYSLAYKRVKQIKRRINQAQYDLAVKNRFKANYKPFDLKSCSLETKRIINQLHKQIGVVQ